jgi:hypothetical protein
MHSYTGSLFGSVFPQWVLFVSLPVLTELTAHLYQAHYLDYSLNQLQVLIVEKFELVENSYWLEAYPWIYFSLDSPRLRDTN